VRQLLLNLAEQQPPPAQILIVEGHETMRGDCVDPDCRICSVLIPHPKSGMRPRHPDATRTET
jgi:hypothetical protein